MAGRGRKILVHVCCASCASSVFPQLAKAGFSTVGFFYNPYLDSSKEMETREKYLRQYAEENGIELLVPEHYPEDFFGKLAPLKDNKSIKFINDADRYRRRRCLLCNETVVDRLIEEAKQHRIKYITSTLLCSPYKDHEQIVRVLNERSSARNINFFYTDFRKGYWMGRNYSKSHNYPSPSYCGCEESRLEKRLH